MLLNKDKVGELMKIYANNNYNEFARKLNLDVSHLYRFLSKGIGGGNKVIGAIAKFCKERNLNFEYFIDLSDDSGYKDIENWEDIFKHVKSCLSLVLVKEQISDYMVIKTTYDMLNDAGYGYSIEDISKKYIT